MKNNAHPRDRYFFDDPHAFDNCTPNDYDAIAPLFDPIMGCDFHQATFGIYKALIDTHISVRPIRHLDLGCGTGILSEMVAKEFDARVHGIDLSMNQLAVAYRRFIHVEGSVLFDQGDITTAKYPRHMDLVTCTMDALNHLNSPDQWQMVFNKTAAALKHGGIFIFDINMPERLLYDWNEVEEVKKGNLHYFQYAEDPETEGDILWRQTPMSILERQNDGTIKEYKAVIRQMALTIDRVRQMLLDAGLEITSVEQSGPLPEGHLFNKNRAFVCTQKPLAAPAIL